MYDDGAGEALASVDVAGRVYGLTVDQAIGPHTVEHAIVAVELLHEGTLSDHGQTSSGRHRLACAPI